MWFLFALLTALAWGCADLFYKKGSNPEDKYSHFKIVIMVGIVMGIHGLFYMLWNDLTFEFFELVKYLPVSFFYRIWATVKFLFNNTNNGVQVFYISQNIVHAQL